MSSGSGRNYLHSIEKNNIEKKLFYQICVLFFNKKILKIHLKYIAAKKQNIQTFHLILFILNTVIQFFVEFTTSGRVIRKLLKNGYIYLFKKKLANEVSSR